MDISSSENIQNRSNLSSVKAIIPTKCENTKLPDTTFENTNNSSINSTHPDTTVTISPVTLPEISPSKILVSRPVSNKVPFKPTRG